MSHTPLPPPGPITGITAVHQYVYVGSGIFLKYFKSITYIQIHPLLDNEDWV